MVEGQDHYPVRSLLSLPARDEPKKGHPWGAEPSVAALPTVAAALPTMTSCAARRSFSAFPAALLQLQAGRSP